MSWRRSGRIMGFILAMLVLGSLLAIASLPSVGLAADEDLPPRPSATPSPTLPPPSPTPVPEPTVGPQPTPRPRPAKGPGGAFIELQLAPGLAGGQGAWTVVQWQDSSGRWHDVEGWQGTVEMSDMVDGAKTWWLAGSLFGQGPFRWLVLEGPGGRQIGASEPFNLPEEEGERLVVTIQ